MEPTFRHRRPTINLPPMTHCQPLFRLFSRQVRTRARFQRSAYPAVIRDSPDAKNVLSFVDGHAALTKIYWDGVLDSNPCDYEPPTGYDCNWDGEWRPEENSIIGSRSL